MTTSPKTAIVLGTGLGQLASEITDKYEFPYGEIPNFPVSTVEGHSGKLIFGRLGGVDVMAMQGRFHYYEGYSMKEVTFPVRVMYELGIKTLFVSNAAGGMNPQFHIGDLMVITDHINMFPEHPLRGKNFPTGPRFPDMHETYDHNLISLAFEIAKEKDIRLQHGVYGISIVTDLGGFDMPVEVSHEEVQQAANKAQPLMTEIMREMIIRSERVESDPTAKFNTDHPTDKWK